MTESAPRPRLQVKFVALSAVGAALVLVPLTGVLRYQGEALRAARDERASLDPMGHVVALQRALLAHGALAAQVLRGQAKVEGLRRQRAGDVNHHLGALNQTLSALAWQRPLEESQALAEDWWPLVRAVDARRISPAASDLAHRLRVEQSLQVMDLLTVAWAPAADPDAAALRNAAAGLPRLALQWAPGTPGDAGATLALLHQARLLAALAATPLAQGDSELARSTLAAQQATQHLLALLQVPAGDAKTEAGGPFNDAHQAALQAVATAHTVVWQHRMRAVQGRVAQHEQARTLTLATLAALLLSGLWLLQRLRRTAPGMVDKHNLAGTAVPASVPGAESGPEAGRLLQRLRDADSAGTRRHLHGQDAQPTLPPVD